MTICKMAGGILNFNNVQRNVNSYTKRKTSKIILEKLQPKGAKRPLQIRCLDLSVSLRKGRRMTGLPGWQMKEMMRLANFQQALTGLWTG